MATLTIRNLDDHLMRRLRLRAACRNRLVEDEARDILRSALAEESSASENLVDAIRRRIEPLGGVELSLPPREPIRKPLD
jgi:plasmid stability protein